MKYVDLPSLVGGAPRAPRNRFTPHFAVFRFRAARGAAPTNTPRINIFPRRIYKNSKEPHNVLHFLHFYTVLENPTVCYWRRFALNLRSISANEMPMTRNCANRKNVGRPRVCRSKAILQSRDAKGQTRRVTGLLQLKVGESMLSGRNETSQHALSRPANAGLCVSPRRTKRVRVY